MNFEKLQHYYIYELDFYGECAEEMDIPVDEWIGDKDEI